MSSSKCWFTAAEGCEVTEHPSVFQGIVDDGEQLSGGGDYGLSGAAPLADALVEVLEVWRVARGDEAALDEGGARQLVAALGDPAAVVGLVRLGNARHHAEVGGELVGAFEVMDVTDSREQNGG